MFKLKSALLITIGVGALTLTACSSSPTDPETIAKEEAEQHERCRQLQQDIEDLKGRPIRRGAAIEYYNSECIAN